MVNSRKHWFKYGCMLNTTETLLLKTQVRFTYVWWNATYAVNMKFVE